MATRTAPDRSIPPAARRRRRRWLRRSLLALALVVVLAAAAVLWVAWSAATKALYPPRQLITTTPSAYGLPYQDVAFRSSDGVPLQGWYLPAQARSRPPGTRPPALVLSHGRGGSRADFLAYLPMFSRAGFSILDFDYRGSGRSGGAFVTIGAKEQLDLRAAVDWLRKRTGDERVAVVGNSMGAATAILTAAKDDKIAVVVADSSFAKLANVIPYNFHEVTGLPPFPFAPVTVWLVQLRAGISVADVDPEGAIARIAPRPVLVIQGTADTTVRFPEGLKVFNAAHEPKQLWVVPGAEHTRAFSLHPPDYERRVVPFLLRALDQRAAA